MREQSSIFVLLFLAAACGDNDPTAEPDAGPDPLPPPVLAWSPCPVISGGTGGGAECGEADVPIDWRQPDGARIKLFVKRIGRIDAPAQIWMLNGGPGASGADFDPLAEQIVATSDELVFYLPDHRGTGRSTRLGCAGEGDASPGGFAILDEEFSACAAEVRETHGANLAVFNTTQAARDLAWLIDQTHRDGQSVNVWGGSYGTRWAQRYLQLQPAQVSSVSLMGVVDATRTMVDYDQIYDDIGRAFLTRCSEDAFCRGRLGPAAATRAQAIWDSLDTGHCAAAQLDKPTLRGFFAVLMLWYWHERALLPATLARLERCNAGDIAALQRLRNILIAPSTPALTDRLQSSLLGLNISSNEFWPAESPSIESLRAIDDKAIVSFGSAVRMHERGASWPRYALDEHAGRYPDTQLPVLIVNGEFDPATPLAKAQEVAAHFTRPNQHFVVGPDATHSFASPTTSGSWCFLSLVLNFARSSTAPITCAADMVPMDFRGTPQVAAFFGTTDVWDGGPTALPVAPPAIADELRRRLIQRSLRF